jgi:hypothetical protein
LNIAALDPSKFFETSPNSFDPQLRFWIVFCRDHQSADAPDVLLLASPHERPQARYRAANSALAALRSTLERGHLNDVASAGVLQTERDQVMYPKLAHVAERLGGRGVTGGWGSLTSWVGLQILSRPGPSRRRGSAEGF